MEPIGDSHQPGPAQWSREQEFFDDAARRAGSFNLPVIEARYRRALSSPLYPLECAYALLGDVRSKRILDVGCGHGEHSLLFAAWGGEVTGVDVSAGAIEVCRRRAGELELASRTTFINAPFESLVADPKRFDVIWTCAFLHHVLDRLPQVLGLFDTLLAQDGRVIFMEPVRMSAWMKRARQFVPVAAAGTPDERPLEVHDIDAVKQWYTFHQTSLFGPLSRAVDRFGLSSNYEYAAALRRRLADAGYRVDRAVMRWRVFEPAAMIMVSSLSRSAASK
jgi:SAM-dependent methyltransferase